ncbi:MAG: hypothetical protein JRI43_05960 [Deltaproteobacteria bacterium]|nr:hypothetical protein [Deltaproteobacteria bacterium]MBW1912699.1 hypothetical protein [Deltaproteobacteria bacterium]
MKRCEQLLLIVTFLGFSWLAMQAVHELGHIIGACITGAEVTRIALHPFIISHTDLGYNPRPLIVVWAGPLIGSILPLTAYLAARLLNSPGIYLFRFFAGFCLITNGVYIAFGPSHGAADTGVMIQFGSPRGLLLVFGFIAASLGLYLWHLQGSYFGLGMARGKVDRKAAITSLTLFLTVAVVEFIINSR